ncbi:MAG TPA: phosphatase PAP2 family protein [Rhizobacter sp.]|jgi:undecaprenyl-diphosphatase|nr:phosphatase PAP2 family protein [Rhizobacter sp.]
MNLAATAHARRRTPRKIFLLRLALGALVLIAAAWLFGAIAEDVVNHDAPLGAIDQDVATWLHAQATSSRTRLMFFVSDLSAPLSVMAMTSVLAIVLLWKRQRSQLLLLVLAVPGGALLNVIMKHLIHRDRPIFEDPIQTLTSYSFPSGHAMGSTVFFGTLAAIAIWQVRDWRLGTLAIIASALLVALICFSRIYLGVHYLSDVIAGFLAGVVWLGACLFAVAALR